MAKNKQEHYVFYPKSKVIDQSTIYLTNQEGIESIENYVDLLEYFKSKEEGDEITLVISGPGGSFNTSIAIMTAIAESKAIVVADVLGSVSSGHSMITLACDAIIPHAGSSIMLHTFSGGAYGKGRDPQNSLEDANVQMREVFDEHILGFMSKEEIDSMLEVNRDIFFSGENLRNRIKSLYKYRQDNNLNKSNFVIELES